MSKTKRKTLTSFITVVTILLFIADATNAATQHDETTTTMRNNKKKTIVLVMGLPRSGSEAIYNFFNNCMSAYTINRNYCCDNDVSYTKTKFPCNDRTCGACVHENMKNNKLPFDGCINNNKNDDNNFIEIYTDFSVETSEPYSWFLPQHYTLPILHNAYNKENYNVIWILNIRDAMKWAKNVLHWYSVTNRFFNAFNIPYYSSSDNNENLNQVVTEGLPKSLSNHEMYNELQLSVQRSNDINEHQRRLQSLINIYNNHTNIIKQFISTYNNNNNIEFIEFNVDTDSTTTIIEQLTSIIQKEYDNNIQIPSNTCWNFDSNELDNDWKDFTLPF